MNIEDVRAALARAAAATPGPWRWWDSNSFRRLSSDATGKDGDVLYGTIQRSDGHPDVVCSEEDKAFIAAARSDVPAMGALLLVQEAELARARRMLSNGPDPIVRVVKADEVEAAEMLETEEMVGLPAKDFDSLLAAVRAVLLHDQEARSLTMAVQTGRIAVDDARVQRIGRGMLACFERLRSLASEYPEPPRPGLRLVGAEAEPPAPAEQPRRNAPHSVDAGGGATFHAITAEDGRWIRVGHSTDGVTVAAIEMTVERAELAKAALGAAINQAKQRREP